MGMTLWFGIQGVDAPVYDEIDRTALQRSTEELDRLCVKLDVKSLSEFVDCSAAMLDISELGDEDEAIELDVIDVNEMSWFDPNEAIATVTALSKELTDNPQVIHVEQFQTQDIVEDLAGILKSLIQAAKQGRSFHLALIS